MNISHTKHDDYYIFSHEPKIRVYLGEASPEDHIHDILEQKKRSASCHYYKIETGEKVTQKEAFAGDKNIWHGERFDGDTPEEAGCIYGYKCDYDFKRKIAMGYMSIGGKQVSYNQNDKNASRLARAYAYNKTLEQYDAEEKAFKVEREEDSRNRPWIANLMMVGGESYYVDDDGKRITTDEHIVLMKKKFGDDVFDKANEKWQAEADNEIKELVKTITGYNSN